ncbi:hypothetical protein ABG768_018818 [Culter alburnus]|uniref:Transposase domain-containing protein n=1 Tax=Culter alburnus TaxID=194366 RepID=A0AAW2AUC7_CULAL
MSSYWSKRRKIQRGVEQDLQKLQSASVETNDEITEERLDCHNISNFEEVALTTPESNNRVESVYDCTLSSSEGGASESFAGNTEDSNDESTDEEDNIRALLSDWAVRKQIPHSSLTELLKILCNKLPELGLPKDSRTLLKTKSVVEIKEVSGGTYFHAGIEHGLLSHLTTSVHPMCQSVSLQVNIDGLPLYKSSNSQFWTVLGLVENYNHGVQTNKFPFVIGMFFGEKKTASLDFLQGFVEEMQHLEKEGFFFEDRNIRVQISAIVCDAPARAFIRNSKGHNGYYGCDKCCQNRVYHNNCMIFPETTV